MSSQRRPTHSSSSFAFIDRHDEAHNLLHHTLNGDPHLAKGPHAAAKRVPWTTLPGGGADQRLRRTMSAAAAENGATRMLSSAAARPVPGMHPNRAVIGLMEQPGISSHQRRENTTQLAIFGDERLSQLHRDQRHEGRAQLLAEHFQGTAWGGVDASVVETPMIDSIRQEHRASHGGSRAALVTKRSHPLSYFDPGDREMKVLAQVLHDAAQVHTRMKARPAFCHSFSHAPVRVTHPPSGAQGGRSRNSRGGARL